MSNPRKRYYLKQACLLGGITTTTGLKHIERRLLAAHKEGKCWVIEARDLAEYLGIPETELPDPIDPILERVRGKAPRVGPRPRKAATKFYRPVVDGKSLGAGERETDDKIA